MPAIRTRMVASLRNASQALAKQIAQGLGMDPMPDAMPRALAKPAKPEVVQSPALSLTARPGDGSITARKVAILVADGSIGKSALDIYTALQARGAVPRFVAPRIGPVKTADGSVLVAQASLENEPGFLFDAMAIADGVDGVAALARDGHTLDFIKDQFRHGKTILAVGASRILLTDAAVGPAHADKSKLPGVFCASYSKASTDAFIAAVVCHRHPGREAQS